MSQGPGVNGEIADLEQEYPLWLGLARRDITPPVGVLLAGYRPRTSNALGHRLRADALACRGEGGTWVLTACDLIGFKASTVQSIREAISSATGLPADAIAVCGTHTHSGPATNLVEDAELADVDRRYMASLEAALVEAALEAYGGAVQGRFETAVTKAPELGSNRRIQLPDGRWENEWQDPEGRHPGYFDPTVMIAAIRRPGGRLESLVVNVGCHPVVLGPESLAVSADYPGYMKDRIEAKTEVSAAIFLQAGGANINPRICIKDDGRYAEGVGSNLAAIVLEALPRLAPVGGREVRCRRVPWRIVRTRDAYKPAGHQTKKKGEVIETEISAFRAGELAVVFLPGELFSEYNAVLRQMSPTRRTLVVSLANDYIGYLPTDEAQREGAYETRMAPAHLLQSDLAEHARRAFGELA